MEIALARFFGSRMDMIVPNVSYGMFNYELDIFMLTKSNYGIEIEVKIEKYDLINDKKKRHKHKNNKIKQLYFAIPDYLLKYQEHIPLEAGIITIIKRNDKCVCNIVKPARTKSQYQFNSLECYKLVRLASLRIWNLKERILKLNDEAML